MSTDHTGERVGLPPRQRGRAVLAQCGFVGRKDCGACELEEPGRPPDTLLRAHLSLNDGVEGSISRGVLREGWARTGLERGGELVHDLHDDPLALALLPDEPGLLMEEQAQRLRGGPRRALLSLGRVAAAVLPDVLVQVAHHLALNMFCQHIYLWMYGIPAADLYRWMHCTDAQSFSPRVVLSSICAARGMAHNPR